MKPKHRRAGRRHRRWRLPKRRLRRWGRSTLILAVLAVLAVVSVKFAQPWLQGVRQPDAPAPSTEAGE